MTPFDWDKAMAVAVPWQQAYATVERETRALLEHNLWHEELSTAAIVDMLYPEEWIDALARHTRKRIFKALRALATRGLADCCHRGPERKSKLGRPVRPWLWHAPTLPNIEALAFKTIACPHCGGHFNANHT